MRRYFIHSKAIAKLEALKQQLFDAAWKRQGATGRCWWWRIPGGGVEPDEDNPQKESAIKEAKSESTFVF